MNQSMKIPDEYVAIPRAHCAKWWPRPYSELRAAAESGVDGMTIAVHPKKVFDKPDGSKKEVDDYPFLVRGHMCFRLAGRVDGFDRDDVAALHTQGW